ncbi:hypothetical protein BKA70DRAFT_1566754 [Coprinopsis sp. MPI-PUGE-AT-0042]|nr:hypothetical protein BKA70DRAFT_1566754 [Coprinopsis sp. MPI-PUGE-AT-0042]
MLVSELNVVALRQNLIHHHRHQQQQHHHHHMARRSVILSLLDGAPNLRGFHVMAPAALRRDFVYAERQINGFGSNGDWECRALPGPLLCFFKPSHPEVDSTLARRPQMPPNSFSVDHIHPIR